MPLALMIAPFLLLAAAPEDSTVVVRGYPWAPFISPLGQPFRFRSTGPAPIERWFAEADRDHDSFLTADELRLDAERFFARLDTSHDGQIDPTELTTYEWEIAPEVQVTDRWRRTRDEVLAATATARPPDYEEPDDDRPARPKTDRYDGYRPDGLQGASRYSLLDIPEPVAAADADFNRAVSLDEFRQAAAERFRLLDRDRLGRVTLPQLEARLPTRPTGKQPKERKGSPDKRIGLPLPDSARD